jgi:2-C-methyl-D-erythritol 4-phosphate cytidylyltransferase
MAALPESERVAAVLLAGGSGKRMGARDSSGKAMPKQFLELQGKSVLQLSLELLQKVDNLDRLVIVLAPEFRDLNFVAAASAADSRIVFADPGTERQNSVENGLAKVDAGCTLVAVHDAARPLVTLDEIHRCLADAAEHGAAVRGQARPHSALWSHRFTLSA